MYVKLVKENQQTTTQKIINLQDYTHDSKVMLPLNDHNDGEVIIIIIIVDNNY